MIVCDQPGLPKQLRKDLSSLRMLDGDVFLPMAEEEEFYAKESPFLQMLTGKLERIGEPGLLPQRQPAHTGEQEGAHETSYSSSAAIFHRKSSFKDLYESAWSSSRRSSLQESHGFVADLLKKVDTSIEQAATTTTTATATTAATATSAATSTTTTTKQTSTVAETKLAKLPMITTEALLDELRGTCHPSTLREKASLFHSTFPTVAIQECKTSFQQKPLLQEY